MAVTSTYLESSNPERKDEITTYDIFFSQRVDDRTGKPVGKPKLNSLSVQIVRSSEEDTPAYIGWQMSPTQTKDLDIAFYDDNQLKREIKIVKAYLVSYNQSMGSPGTVVETLVISPTSITIEGVEYSREEAS